MQSYDIKTKNADGFDEHVWKINSVKQVAENRIFKTLEINAFLPSKNIERNFVGMEMNNWVHVYAETKAGDVILVKQHRIGSNEVTYEVPAGTVEAGEDPCVAAERELREETGYVPEMMEFLGEFSANPAIQTNKVYIYWAHKCHKVEDLHLDEAEDIEVVLATQDDISDIMENVGAAKFKVTHALSQLAILRGALASALGGDE